MKTVLLAVVAGFSSCLLSDQAVAQVGGCEAVLVNQIETISAQDRATIAWLKVIDQNSYSSAKVKGALSIYGGWFSGDYGSFKAKRDAHFSQDSGQVSRESQLEEYKSYLKDSQIDAWLACQGGNPMIQTHYKDVDLSGATIVLSWRADEAIGPLRNVKFNLNGVAQQPEIGSDTGFSGETSFAVQRQRESGSIRGTVTGVAGWNNKNFQATIYIPAYQPYTPPPRPPLKKVEGLNGQVRTSIAYWGNGSRKWNCVEASDDRDLVIISTADRGLGRRRGRCVGNGSFCNSHHEHCTDIVITNGCFVNRRWHEWYQSQLEAIGEAYRKESVCDPATLT